MNTRSQPSVRVVSSSDSSSPPVILVGAGAMGTALARGLRASGYHVAAVLSRTAEKAQALAERVGASVAGPMETSLPAAARLVLLCVPDDAIRDVAETLAARDHPWDRTIVAHTSGAKTAAELGPLAQNGAAPMSFHPLQTFAPDTPPEAFEGIVVSLEGDDRATAAGKTLARALGARPVLLTAEDKVRYHCAAALASNGLVALMAVVNEVFPEMSGETGAQGSGLDQVRPLVEQTMENLERGPPEGVLTGPVVRGDEETVRAHLEELAEETPHLVPLYVALSTEMVRGAVRGGRLSPSRADSLLHILQAAAEGQADENSSSHSR